jgi:hypothetical protein
LVAFLVGFFLEEETLVILVRWFGGMKEESILKKKIDTGETLRTKVKLVHSWDIPPLLKLSL